MSNQPLKTESVILEEEKKELPELIQEQEQMEPDDIKEDILSQSTTMYEFFRSSIIELLGFNKTEEKKRKYKEEQEQKKIFAKQLIIESRKKYNDPLIKKLETKPIIDIDIQNEKNIINDKIFNENKNIDEILNLYQIFKSDKKEDDDKKEEIENNIKELSKKNKNIDKLILDVQEYEIIFEYLTLLYGDQFEGEYASEYSYILTGNGTEDDIKGHIENMKIHNENLNDEYKKLRYAQELMNNKEAYDLAKENVKYKIELIKKKFDKEKKLFNDIINMVKNKK